MAWGNVSPAARVAGIAIVALAIAWPVAGGRLMDRIDAALTPDRAGCAHSGDRAASDLRAAEAATLCLLDVQRREHGLPPFAREVRLDEASRRHSGDMAAHDYFAHRGRNGSRPFDRMVAAGWPRARGGGAENIAWGAGAASTPAEIVDGWMHSPGHRANILDPRNRLIGVGIAPGAPASTGAPDPATFTTDFA
jgi:uncharacterized protein YkwD